MDRRRRLPSLTHSNATGTFPGAFVTVTTMTDHTTEPAAHTVTDEDLQAAYTTHPDPLLNRLARHSRFLSFPVTITIPGATITGVVEHRKNYLDEERRKIAGQIAKVPVEEGPNAPEIRELHEETPDFLFPDVEEEKMSDNEYLLPHRFLHLKNAEMVGNGYTHLAPLEVEHLRIPIAQITSWFIGSPG